MGLSLLLSGCAARLPDRAEVASLAQLVDTRAQQGDRVAVQIIEEAADSISDTVEDMIDHLGIAGAKWPMIAVGSVATRSKLYWRRVCRRICEVAPLARPLVPKLYPVLVMALIGLQKLGAADTDVLRRNLLESMKLVWPAKENPET